MSALTVVLALMVALGYFALAGVVLPRIELVGASPSFRRAFRVGGIAFFAGCGLTHTHIAVHALEDGDLIAVHEVIFHVFQAIGVWVFVYVALKMIDVRVERRRTPAELLEEQVAALSRSNEDLESFADVVAHDLRGPLRTADGFAELLERREAEALSEQGREFVAALRRSHHQLGELLDGILRSARGGPEQREEADMAEVVRDVLRALSSEIDERGATVEVGELPVVAGDRVQLRQVMLNLVGNALKFHGSAPQIEIAARRLNEHWIFSVRDHGPGIAPGEAERIFEMFARGDGAQRTDGSGIGLAVCRKIVERHGGTIAASPADGGGSVFRFTLPATVPEPAPSPTVASS